MGETPPFLRGNMYDIILKNGQIYDGALHAAYTSDVAIKNGKIVAIASCIDTPATEILDATNRIVCPGFVDSHSHTDMSAVFDPSNFQKLEQGITSEAVGQCGITLFPVNAENYENTNKILGCTIAKPDNFDPTYFTSTSRWLAYLETLKLGTNLIPFVGHGAIRANVMGFAARVCNDDELEAMQNLLIEAMESGARGLSSGLAYAPGVFADKSELTTLCRIVAKYNGVYTSHMKNQGIDLINSVQNTIDISRETGCMAVISHLKSIGKPNWGKVRIVVDMVKKAQAEGVTIYYDAYPYLAGSTTIQVTLPPSVLEGGESKICQRLSTQEGRDYVKNQIENPTEHWENAIGNNGFNSIVIIEAAHTPEAEGKSIEEYARDIGKDSFTTYYDLIVANNCKMNTLNFVMSEEDMLSALSYENAMIGTDGSTSPRSDKRMHPRNVGTFPKFLGEFVRDKKIMSWVKAIHKCTGLPAKVYGLKNKGCIKEGFDADIVVFNPETIKATSDFMNCYGANIGLDYVICGGVISVRDNAYTGLTGGGVLRFA